VGETIHSAALQDRGRGSYSSGVTLRETAIEVALEALVSSFFD